MFYYIFCSDLKHLNLNELRERISDANKKLEFKLEDKDLEKAKKELQDDYDEKIQQLRSMIDHLK